MPKTIKNGDNVIVKQTGDKAKVTSIENGRYQLDIHPDFLYWHYEIIAVKNKPAVKKREYINKVSSKKEKLDAIYKIISAEFKRKNNRCRARYAGCTGAATEIHHQYKRTGFWLIVSKYFLPICKHCHREANTYSKRAIELSISVSRYSKLDYNFTSRERELLEKSGLRIPD